MSKGGKRARAGRPKGSTMYGEPTERIRVPVSMVAEIKQFAATRGMTLPLYSDRVQAGYPSAAEAHVDERVDLNSYLVQHPEKTFLVHAAGDSMIDAGIRDGDLLVVDSSIKPAHGKIVVAALDGAVTVKFLIMKKNRPYLMPANAQFNEIPINPENNVVIWGVVTSSIQKH